MQPYVTPNTQHTNLITKALGGRPAQSPRGSNQRGLKRTVFDGQRKVA